jgi:ABC-2 type transport system permease protein
VVAQFLGLKLRLLANTFKRSPWQIVGMLIALLYGLGAASFAVIGLVGLRFVDPEVARVIVIAAGSLIVAGFLVVPLAFGVDDTLDPRKFSLFGISTSKLAALLALTALVSIPSLAIIFVGLAQVVTWSRGALPTFLSLLSAVLIVVTCVLGARVTTSLAAFLLSTRRAREITGLVALVALVAVSPAIALLASVNWASDGLAALTRIVDFVSWTPLGAAWAAPADAATGNASVAIQKFFLAIVFAALLWAAWRALVATMLVTPPREGRSRTYTSLGWFDRLPATPLGAIAARSFTYWLRDARYRVQLVIVPIVPMLMVVVFLLGGVYWQNLALLPLPIMCLFLSWSVHNDVAYDNTAIWLHVASNVSGVADRLGRIIPVLLLGAVLIAVGAPITAALYGDWSALPSVIGVSACILLSGLGLSSLLSARFPYPAVRPGDSPFTQPQASGGAASLVQSIAFLATVLLTVPSLLIGLFGLVERETLPALSLVTGLAVGLTALVLGVRLGGKTFERRGPELLAFTQRN